MFFNSPQITRLSKPRGTNTSTNPSPFTSTVKVHHIKITPTDVTTPNLYYHDVDALMNSLFNNPKPKWREIIAVGITLQPFRREKYPTLTSLSPFFHTYMNLIRDSIFELRNGTQLQQITSIQPDVRKIQYNYQNDEEDIILL